MLNMSRTITITKVMSQTNALKKPDETGFHNILHQTTSCIQKGNNKYITNGSIVDVFIL